MIYQQFISFTLFISVLTIEKNNRCKFHPNQTYTKKEEATKSLFKKIIQVTIVKTVEIVILFFFAIKHGIKLISFLFILML